MLVYIDDKDDKEFCEHREYAYVYEYDDYEYDDYDYEEDSNNETNEYEINYEVDEYLVS